GRGELIEARRLRDGALAGGAREERHRESAQEDVWQPHRDRGGEQPALAEGLAERQEEIVDEDQHETQHEAARTDRPRRADPEGHPDGGERQAREGNGELAVQLYRFTQRRL